jgi:hypothetical protein
MQKVQAEEQSDVPTQYSPGGTEEKYEMRELTELFVSWSLYSFTMLRLRRSFNEIKRHSTPST